MKILAIIRKYPGGVGRVVHELSREFERNGHTIRTVSREEDLGVSSFVSSIFLIRNFVQSEMKKENYDIIYTHDWSIALPLLFPYPLFRDKHFCCFHGNEPRSISCLLQTLVGHIMGRHLIVVGDSLKKRFPQSKLVYNGVDIEKFKPSGSRREGIGFANWPVEEYNFHIIKRAVESANEKFRLAQDIPFGRMPDFYSEIETFISLPPAYTGFNLVWLEAMAAGVPRVIGNNEGVGQRLPITKVEDFGWNNAKTEDEKIKVIRKTIENAEDEEKDYRKWLEENDFSWRTACRKLIKIWNENLIDETK